MLHGYEIATVLTRLNMPQVLDADHTVLAPDAEAAQPLYAGTGCTTAGPRRSADCLPSPTCTPSVYSAEAEFASAAAAYRIQ